MLCMSFFLKVYYLIIVHDLYLRTLLVKIYITGKRSHLQLNNTIIIFIWQIKVEVINHKRYPSFHLSKYPPNGFRQLQVSQRVLTMNYRNWR